MALFEPRTGRIEYYRLLKQLGTGDWEKMDRSCPRPETLVARYFFNLHDGMDLPDTVGSEHSNLASVRTEAVESIAERLRGRLLDKIDVSAWVMNVTEEAGVTVLILSMAATVYIVNAPAAGTE